MDARLCTAAASELERAFAGAMTRLRRFSDANLGRRALRPARKGARIRERCFATIVNGPLMLERRAQAPPDMTWTAGSLGCVVVALRGARKPPSHMELTLVSDAAIVSATWLGCEAIGVEALPAARVRACRFRFLAPEPSTYALDLRSDVCRIAEPAQGADAWAGHGFQFGREAEVRFAHRAATLRVVADEDDSSSRVRRERTLPACTFAHDALLAAGEGAPRWRDSSAAATDKGAAHWRSKYWYDDKYWWGSDLCAHRPPSGAELARCAARQGVRSIKLVGDSLTRHMFNELEDLFSGVGPLWLHKHPIAYEPRGAEAVDDEIARLAERARRAYVDRPDDALNASALAALHASMRDYARAKLGAKYEWSNWDGVLSGWFAGDSTITSDLFPLAAGYCLRHGRRLVDAGGEFACCARGTCAGGAAEPIFSLRQFLPGIGESPKRARTEHEWEAALARFLEPATPDVLVFNAGLHLLDYPSPPDELRKILRALLRLCARAGGVALVWRATLYHHRRLASAAAIRAMNDAAARELRDRPRAFVFGSAYDMSRSRPDRTSDGFHYSYRKKRSTWRKCAQADSGGFQADCVRAPDFPRAVSAGATLALASMLCSTNLTDGSALVPVK